MAKAKKPKAALCALCAKYERPDVVADEFFVPGDLPRTIGRRRAASRVVGVGATVNSGVVTMANDQDGPAHAFRARSRIRIERAETQIENAARRVAPTAAQEIAMSPRPKKSITDHARETQPEQFDLRVPLGHLRAAFKSLDQAASSGLVPTTHRKQFADVVLLLNTTSEVAKSALFRIFMSPAAGSSIDKLHVDAGALTDFERLTSAMNWARPYAREVLREAVTPSDLCAQLEMVGASALHVTPWKKGQLRFPPGDLTPES